MRCLLRGHEAAPGPVRNQGLEFGHCRHCRRDLLRTNRRWRSVPRGFRVVWQREPRAAQRDAAQLELDLASPGRALVAWRADLSLAGRARSAATGIASLMTRWLPKAGMPRGKVTRALLRIRTRTYVILRPVTPRDSCICLPYRPLARF